MTNQQPEIKHTDAIRLVGMCETTSVATMNPAAIWQRFMPRRNEIDEHVQNQYYSVQVYDEEYSFQNFDANATFQKWAAVAVDKEVEVPNGMQTMQIPAGMYAVFIHKGTAPEFSKTLQHIHGVWLPNSKYELDNRPHFEFLDDRYLGPMNPKSEEEVWVPIKAKV